jgi:hypothetical protein
LIEVISATPMAEGVEILSLKCFRQLYCPLFIFYRP